ncbi:conserved hypothetical protein [Bradyrhizobium sp. STM 3843]|nr:conserved hypothetical protein [Bradyrhizobium sp. STM 3843]
MAEVSLPMTGTEALGQTSVRKTKEGEVSIDVYGLLTTEPNEIVVPIHRKAMPVILTTVEEYDVWIRAPRDGGVTSASAGRYPRDRGARRRS